MASGECSGTSSSAFDPYGIRESVDPSGLYQPNFHLSVTPEPLRDAAMVAFGRVTRATVEQYRALVANQWEGVETFLTGMTGDNRKAREHTEAIFTEAFAALAQSPGDIPRVWLYQRAMRLCRDETEQTSRAEWEAADQLQEKWRMAFYLNYYGFSHEAIADKLGMKAATVTGLLREAKEAVQLALHNQSAAS